MHRVFETNLLAVFFALAAISALAAEPRPWDPFTRAPAASDLVFPAEPIPLERSVGMHLFKPDGHGPFPALVLMPTCGNVVMGAWSEEALRRGYVVLRVDPFGPRQVTTNCDVVNVRMARLMKDAFDAAAYLRTLDYVRPSDIGLLGFSQGGFVGLGAASELYWKSGGRPPFAAILAAFPTCRRPGVQHPETGEQVEIVYAPKRVRVPLLVELGGRDDSDGGLPRNGCDGAFDTAFANGDPLTIITYSAGHKWDQEGPPDVTRRSIDDAFRFLDENLQR